MYGLPLGDYEWTPAALDRLTELLPSDSIRILETVKARRTELLGGKAETRLAEVEIYWKEDNGEMVAVSEVLSREEHLFRFVGG